MSQAKRIVIIGGVAGGAAAAARARRLSESARILLVERGEHISFANCGMPYHIGGAIAQRERLLVQTPSGMAKRYGIEVRTRTQAVRIDRQGHTVLLRDSQTAQEVNEPYDELILSPGAEPVRLAIPGGDHPLVFTLRSLADMDAINAALAKASVKRAVIIGGGYIGLEMAEAIHSRGLDVTLVELADQVFVAIDPEMAAPIHQQLALHGVELDLGTSVAGIESAGGGVEVTLKAVSDGRASAVAGAAAASERTVQAGLVILSVGVRPEVKLAREAGLAIGPTGGILTDEHMRTSDEHIYAVGDAIEVNHLLGGRALIPLAGPASRQGRVAADNALGRDSVYRGTQGTAICKVFDLAVGMTGMSEKALLRAGRAYEKVYVHPVSHAGYYPGAAPMSLKLLFEPVGGKILGAQAVGTDGVDKRIDVLAVAMRAGMSVLDLQELELSYAPPYGSAKDPVNYAGFAAANVIKGDVLLFHAKDALNPRPDQLLLDVRMSAEVQAGTISGSLSIPVDELRSRLAELPRDKELLVFCQVGLRGYVACRILSQNGFRCRNLSGGYKTFQAATARVGPLAGAASTPAPPCAACASSQPAQTAKRPAVQGAAPTGPMAAQAPPAELVDNLDCRSMQCPGPIIRLKQELEALKDGQAISIIVDDPGFPADVAAWCHSTGHKLLKLERESNAFKAVLVKQPASAASPIASPAAELKRNKTIVVFSNDLDRAMGAFIIANGAAAMGSTVTMFFTFWGLNVLRKPEAVRVSKGLIERMFGWMTPRGAGRLGLSKLNMAGLGRRLMLGAMKRKGVPSLTELIATARQAGVKLVACSMSMGVMGIKREELLEGVEEAGVAAYLDAAEAGNVNLFI